MNFVEFFRNLIYRTSLSDCFNFILFINFIFKHCLFFSPPDIELEIFSHNILQIFSEKNILWHQKRNWHSIFFLQSFICRILIKFRCYDLVHGSGRKLNIFASIHLLNISSYAEIKLLHINPFRQWVQLNMKNFKNKVCIKMASNLLYIFILKQSFKPFKMSVKWAALKRK